MGIFSQLTTGDCSKGEYEKGTKVTSRRGNPTILELQTAAGPTPLPLLRHSSPPLSSQTRKPIQKWTKTSSAEISILSAFQMKFVFLGPYESSYRAFRNCSESSPNMETLFPFRHSYCGFARYAVSGTF